MAPQKIENMFKGDPLFTQFIVIGEKKKYLSGLCNINLEEAERLALENHIEFNEPLELLNNEKFVELVQEHVDKKNKELARYETIKKFRIVQSEFSQETGELTPSLKVKRKVVGEKYGDIIDTMYDVAVADNLK